MNIIKVVYIGAAPLTTKDAAAFAARLPDVKLVQSTVVSYFIISLLSCSGVSMNSITSL